VNETERSGFWPTVPVNEGKPGLWMVVQVVVFG
jgi:hypothetical protein